MRWWVPWGLVVLGSGCGQQPLAGPSEDVLILELGGDHEPLRSALLRLRPPPAAATPRPAPEPAPERGAGPAEPGRADGAEPDRPASPPPRPEILTISLKPGETLFGLARRHLGDGSRWRELLALNGWTEAEAARLPVGTPVRIPVR